MLASGIYRVERICCLLLSENNHSNSGLSTACETKFIASVYIHAQIKKQPWLRLAQAAHILAWYKNVSTFIDAPYIQLVFMQHLVNRFGGKCKCQDQLIFLVVNRFCLERNGLTITWFTYPASRGQYTRLCLRIDI